MSKIRPRRHDRERLLRDVRFRVLPSGPNWRGSTIDMSPSGARLFSEQSVQPGDLLELSAPVTGPGPGPRLIARVVDVQVRVEGTWAGLQFVNPLGSEVFRTLCAQGGRPAPD